MSRYLLVRLHLAPHYPEGVVGGVVVDLDSTEGLGSCTGRQPLLAAVVVDHHGGPSLANTGLTATAQTQKQLKPPQENALKRQLATPTPTRGRPWRCIFQEGDQDSASGLLII